MLTLLVSVMVIRKLLAPVFGYSGMLSQLDFEAVGVDAVVDVGAGDRVQVLPRSGDSGRAVEHAQRGSEAAEARGAEGEVAVVIDPGSGVGGSVEGDGQAASEHDLGLAGVGGPHRRAPRGEGMVDLGRPRDLEAGGIGGIGDEGLVGRLGGSGGPGPDTEDDAARGRGSGRSEKRVRQGEPADAIDDRGEDRVSGDGEVRDTEARGEPRSLDRGESRRREQGVGLLAIGAGSDGHRRGAGHRVGPHGAGRRVSTGYR